MESLSQQISELSVAVAEGFAAQAATKSTRKSKTVPHASSMLTQENAAVGGVPGAVASTGKPPKPENVMQHFGKNYEQFKSFVPAEVYELSRSTKMSTSTYSKGTKPLTEEVIVSGIWGANNTVLKESVYSDELKARCLAFKTHVTAVHEAWKPSEVLRLSKASAAASPSDQVDVLSQPVAPAPLD
jgi:hypothetical protein